MLSMNAALNFLTAFEFVILLSMGMYIFLRTARRNRPVIVLLVLMAVLLLIVRRTTWG